MAEGQANDSGAAAAPEVEVEGARIFVGNLPFKTRQEDLVTLFEVGGNHACIPRTCTAFSLSPFAAVVGGHF